MAPLLSRTITYALAFLFVLTVGCEDPSGVGLEVVGEVGGDPVRVRVEPVFEGSQQVSVVTGNIFSPSLGFAGASIQMMAGIADDPYFGRLETQGYVDFTAPSVTDAFRDSTIRRAEIELPFLSVYGDTLSSISIVVDNMETAWEVTTLRSDTTLAVGTRATVADVEPGSSVNVALPDEWVAEFDSKLRGSNFVEDFHGFRISSSEPGAILGINGTTALLRLYSGADTLAFPASKFFTAIQRTTETAYPLDRIGVQDGLADGALFSIPVSADSVVGGVLARVALRFQVDTLAFSVGQSFLRPVTSTFSLYGVRSDGTRDFLRTADLLVDGSVSFVSSAADASQLTLVRAVQNAMTGSPVYSQYLVLPVGTPAAVNATLFMGPGSISPPTAALTLVQTIQ